jgi:hypothetical protein
VELQGEEQGGEAVLSCRAQEEPFCVVFAQDYLSKKTHLNPQISSRIKPVVSKK